MSNQTWVKGEANGRIDFMGGVADYSGAWVLQTPIKAKTTVKIRYITGDSWLFNSHQKGTFGFSNKSWSQFRAAALESLAAARKSLENVPIWGRYVLGCIAVLLYHRKWPDQLKGPFKVMIDSKVPLGMGVSSSAAIEVATLRALTGLAQLSWSGTELARLAQQAENEIVGAPCGLMDQLAVAYGKQGALLPILCRPDHLEVPIKLPAGVTVVGWPSGVKHDVGAAPYAIARCSAFIGRKILESRLKINVAHLSEISVSEFVRMSSSLPQAIQGREFVLRFGNHDDALTALPPLSADPNVKEALDRNYPIRSAARFPIEESYRVQLVKEILRSLRRRSNSTSSRQNTLNLIGELLFQSHEGYNRMDLGSSITDDMVAAIRKLGPDHGFYGARISGGGSGGTVVVLLEKSSLPELQKLRFKLCTSPELIYA